MNAESFRGITLAGFLVAIGAPSARAAEPDDSAAAQAAKEFQAHAKAEAAAYEIRAESAEGPVLQLQGDAVLRWANPLGGRNAHGDVFLWTDEGRPAAVLSLYEFTSPDGVVHEHHEFCSLATGPLVTKAERGRSWSPKEPGVKPVPLPDAPPPAGSAVRRLSQMRELASRFAGKKTTRPEGEVRDLRVLTQPVFRFESKKHQVLDGALFALVEANDPEVFLMLETRVVDEKPQWHYGLARMNSLRLQISLDEAEVWNAELLPWRDALNRQDLPYTAFTVR
jgi:hypothetical protein